MSWPTWSAAAPPMPAAVAAPVQSTLLPTAINSAPTVIPPNLAQYTPEQWAHAQQNWQQWAQWQQQYQQWHQQYGAEYQKSLAMQAAVSQPPLPTPGTATLAPPLPVESKPPLPPEDPPNVMSSYSTAPPKPVQTGYSTAPPSIMSQQHAQLPPQVGDPYNQRQNWQNAQKRPYGLDAEHEPAKKPNIDKGTTKWAGQNPTSQNPWPGSNQNFSQPPPQTQTPATGANKNVNVEELSEAEKKFDKEFAAWEAQFNKWKEQNANHPDKTQYREYEKKWESWRNSLLERREQMRRKRLALAAGKQQPPAGNFNQPPPATNTSTPGSQVFPQEVQNQALGCSQISSAVNQHQMPPPHQNNEPLAFKTGHSKQDDANIDTGFLGAPSSSAGGIPGLDLVKDDGKEQEVESRKSDVIDVEKDDKPLVQQPGRPDLDAISKGINNILGDQKLMSMLSMVTQNPPPTAGQAPPNQGYGQIRPNYSAPPPLDAPFGNMSVPPPSTGPYSAPPPNIPLHNEQSNQSYEDKSNQEDFHSQREDINNFDDQTRSSFTLGPNDHEQGFRNRGSRFTGDVVNNFGPGGSRTNVGPGGPRMENFGLGSSRNDNFGPGGPKNENIVPGNLRSDSIGTGSQRNDNFGPGGPRNENFGPGGFRNDNLGPGGTRNDNFAGRNDNFRLGGPRNESFGPSGSRNFTSTGLRNSLTDNFGSEGRNSFGRDNDRFGPNRSTSINERFPQKDDFGENYDNENTRFGNFRNKFDNAKGNFNQRDDNRKFNRSGNFKKDNYDDYDLNEEEDYDKYHEMFNEDEQDYDQNYKQEYNQNYNDDHKKDFNNDYGNQDYQGRNQSQGFQNRDFPHNRLQAKQESIQQQIASQQLHHQQQIPHHKPPPLMETIIPQPPQLQEKPIEEEAMFEPTTVIDYEHKSQKKNEFEVTVEPARMFDYRHKPLNRIPCPQRPNWLSECVRFIREFDPMAARMFDRPVERIERFTPARNRSYEEKDRMVYDERGRFEKENRFDRDSKFEKDDRSDRDYSRNDFDSDRNRRRSFDREDRFDRRRNTDDKTRNPEKRSLQSKHSKSDIKESLEDLSEDEMDWETGEKNKFEGKSRSPSPLMSNPPNPSASVKEITTIDDIINPPGRFGRPPRIVIILRGPPGSGKTHLARLIKDKEVEHGGSAPRILSLDDYFMIEHEKQVVEDGKTVTVKEMIYEYEADMEESYRNSFTKSFKKTITDGFFPFIIVDNINDKVKYFGKCGVLPNKTVFRCVYICQMDLDPVLCTKRNVHNRTEAEIEDCIAGWEPTPTHHPTIDASGFLQANVITEVEMEVVEQKPPEEEPEKTLEDHVCSKWDTFDCSSNNLAKLDGLNKPIRKSKTMEEYLQLESEWKPSKPTKPGQKRVRWADLEEQRQLEKMKAMGFVIGHTNWDKMMDPTAAADRALRQTKFI